MAWWLQFECKKKTEKKISEWNNMEVMWGIKGNRFQAIWCWINGILIEINWFFKRRWFISSLACAWLRGKLSICRTFFRILLWIGKSLWARDFWASFSSGVIDCNKEVETSDRTCLSMSEVGVHILQTEHTVSINSAWNLVLRCKSLGKIK